MIRKGEKAFDGVDPFFEVPTIAFKHQVEG